MSENTPRVWLAQDRLEAGIRALDRFPEAIPVDLGHPKNVEPIHVWVSGDVADWTFDAAETDDDLLDSDTTFVLKVCVYRVLAGTYGEIRTEIGSDVAAIAGFIRADHTLAGAVSQARIAKIAVNEGRDANGRREVGADVFIRCDCWD